MFGLLLLCQTFLHGKVEGFNLAMDRLPLDWKWQSIALLSTAYLTACHLLRYRFRDGLQAKYPYKTREDLKSMTAQHAYEIHKAIFATEFPFMFEKALEFALFRFDLTHGILSKP
jgi:hypothetical protein